MDFLLFHLILKHRRNIKVHSSMKQRFSNPIK